jgi:hypothetical protein
VSCEQEKLAYLAAEAALADHGGCPPITDQNRNDPVVLACHIQLQTRQEARDRARRALEECENGVRLLNAEGLVTLLRVHDKETNYGGGRSNTITADVIFKLDSRPDKSFGFEMRDDDNLPTRQGMLALLRDALVHDLRVSTDYLETATTPNQNCFVIRVWLTKSRSPIDVRSDQWLVEESAESNIMKTKHDTVKNSISNVR